jgi:hypothetical protein
MVDSADGMLTSIARGISVYIYNELYDLESYSPQNCGTNLWTTFLAEALRVWRFLPDSRKGNTNKRLLTQNVTVRQSNLHMTLYASHEA